MPRGCCLREGLAQLRRDLRELAGVDAAAPILRGRKTDGRGSAHSARLLGGGAPAVWGRPGSRLRDTTTGKKKEEAASRTLSKRSKVRRTSAGVGMAPPAPGSGQPSVRDNGGGRSGRIGGVQLCTL